MKNFKYILGIFAMLALGSCEKEDVAQNESTNFPTKNMQTNGLGGSLSQFIVIDNYLYTVDYRTLNVFHLADPTNPVLLESIDMGVGMETIFSNNDFLYIGAQDGVHIYDITNPRFPEEVSSFEHVTSCDPVVANDNYAIATLRGGTECGGNLSQMTILDVSDISHPAEIYTEELINPYGLGFSNSSNNIVYICDGYAGLKAYDISNSMLPVLVMEMPDLEAMDVLGKNDLLVVLTRQGIYQYDASNPLALVEKSFIPVQ